MRVVAITAFHCTLEDFVMERQIKLVFDFGVAVHAELRLTCFQQPEGREARFLRVRIANENV